MIRCVSVSYDTVLYSVPGSHWGAISFDCQDKTRPPPALPPSQSVGTKFMMSTAPIIISKGRTIWL